MESRDPYLRVSLSKDSRLVSVSKAAGLETLNVAKKLFSKTSIIQRFMFVVFAGMEQPKQVRNMPEIRKKVNLEMMTTIIKN